MVNCRQSFPYWIEQDGWKLILILNHFKEGNYLPSTIFFSKKLQNPAWKRRKSTQPRLRNLQKPNHKSNWKTHCSSEWSYGLHRTLCVGFTIHLAPRNHNRGGWYSKQNKTGWCGSGVQALTIWFDPLVWTPYRSSDIKKQTSTKFDRTQRYIEISIWKSSLVLLLNIDNVNWLC